MVGRKRRRQHSARYKAHLASPQWATIRKAALERANYRCAFCGQTQDKLFARGRHLEVHHSTYENLGSERPEDLTVLCAGRGGCHAAADRQRRAANRRWYHRRSRRRRSGPRPFKWLRRFVIATLAVVLAPIYLPLFGSGVLVGDSCERPEKAVRVYLSKAKYPRIIAHIKESWREGYPHVLKVHRKNADKRRDKLLGWYQARHPQPKGDGLDLDEAPAVVLRSTWRASVKPVPQSENRSAGAVLGNAIDEVCSGTKVLYVFTA